MKKLIKKLLRENLFKSPFKGQNILFHSTQYDRAINILNDNEIFAATKQTIKTKLNKTNPNYNENSKNYNGVSLTRDSKLQFGDVQFILDGDLIKRDYGNKLVPFDFFSSYLNKSSLNRSESEEFLIGPLKNIKKYLLGIRIIRVYQSLRSFYEEDREGYYIFKESIGRIPLFDEKFNEIEL